MNKIKRSITEKISDNKKINDKQEIAVRRKLDKATNQVITKKRIYLRIFNGEHEYYSNTSQSSVSDVNQYGNGSKTQIKVLLSKSKDSRQYCRTIPTVESTKRKISEQSIS